MQELSPEARAALEVARVGAEGLTGKPDSLAALEPQDKVMLAVAATADLHWCDQAVEVVAPAAQALMPRLHLD